MGTIDISYWNLLVGLLMMGIPLYFLWKFKTGLVQSTLIAVIRMLVQLFLIGVYLKYLFIYNHPLVNFLWVFIMIIVAAETALVRTRIQRKVLLIDPELMKIAYESGVGMKGSQGWGMVKNILEC